MTLGSLFSGSGSFELAGALNGFTPVWASEVEPYPIAVSSSRFPLMQHLGNIQDIHGDSIEPVDLICGGFPCTDVSVAGKRGGLHAARTGLFWDMIRIIKEMRHATNGQYPRYVVAENVPGLFSSAKGADFRAVLQAFVSLCDDTLSVPEPPKGKWLHAGEIVGDHFSLAWRV